VLITGARGQVGLALQAMAPAAWQLVACGTEELDVTRPEAVADVLERERPTTVIHAAAYTAVDAAEEDAGRAEAVNATGARLLAERAHRIGARLIHLSTDYVFDGGQGQPYGPDDAPHPLGVYGRTKLAGERAVAEATAGSALILRTSWVYGGHGRNFVLGLLQAMREEEEVCPHGRARWPRPSGGRQSAADSGASTTGPMPASQAGSTSRWRFRRRHWPWGCWIGPRRSGRFGRASIPPVPGGRPTACSTRARAGRP
jgi:nucleoside-diphosphate-sugar epimerase